MQALLDTTILFSALLMEGKQRALVEALILSGYTIVITDLIIDELTANIQRKFPATAQAGAMRALEQLKTSPLVRVKTHREYREYIGQAREYIVLKDVPVLAAGLQEEITAVISSDSHFIQNHRLEFLRRKKIFTTDEFLARMLFLK